MDARHLVHFVNATKSVFSMMLQLPVACAMPQRTDDLPARTADVSGIIGLSGDAVGCVVLAFPRESAVKVIERFVGSPLDPVSDDFADAVGELVNMISGSAKAQIEGHDIRISVPSVVVGDNHKVQTMSDATCVRIPCNSELGPFSIEVALRFGETAGVIDAAVGESRAA